MAKRITEILVDDLDGTEIVEGAGRSVKFAFEGVNYEIDLTEEHADEFREALSSYIAVARKTGSSVRSSSRPGSRASSSNSNSNSNAGNDLKVVRAWLRAQGEQVSDRGRIPAALLAKYEAAH